MDPLPSAAGSDTGVWLSTARARVFHALSDHNPFYLLSAACMLLGCLLLTNSLSWTSIAFSRLLILLVTINLYELLLLGLGLYLLGRKGGQSHTRRDASQLITLAVVFMVDAAFLVAEIVSLDLRLGAALSLTLLVLAIGKSVLILRATGVRLDHGKLCAGGAMLVGLFALPCVFKAVGDTKLTDWHFYFAWWAAAILWAMYDVAAYRPGRAKPAADAVKSAVSPVLLFVAIPFLSLLTHLGILHYVYNRPFVAPEAAPMLLVASAIMVRQASGRRHDKRSDTPAILAGLAKVLPVVAVLVSIDPHGVLARGVPVAPGVAPWMLSVLGALLTLVWLHYPRHIVHTIVTAMFGAVVFAFGPTPSEVFGLLSRIGSWFATTVSGGASTLSAVLRRLWGLLPQTPGQWGVLAVVSSFLLLCFGAFFSLRRRPPLATQSAHFPGSDGAPPELPQAVPSGPNT